MITKKEDLIGTYIKNDNGELRELYIAACEALLVDGTPRDLMMSNDEWLGPNIDCKVIGVYEGGMFISNSYCSDGKELTISDLKPIPTETPEEKEALDAIEQVEWKNGDLVEYRNKNKGEGGLLIFVGIHPTHKDHAVLYGKHLNGGYMSAPLSMLSKPESPEAKQEREELEAAYDLYCEWNCHPEHALSLDELKVEPDWRERWLRVVRKTGYRKGE